MKTTLYRIGCLLILPVYVALHITWTIASAVQGLVEGFKDNEMMEGYPMFWEAFKAGERQ